MYHNKFSYVIAESINTLSEARICQPCSQHNIRILFISSEYQNASPGKLVIINYSNDCTIKQFLPFLLKTLTIPSTKPHRRILNSSIPTTALVLHSTWGTFWDWQHTIKSTQYNPGSLNNLANHYTPFVRCPASILFECLQRNQKTNVTNNRL